MNDRWDRSLDETDEMKIRNLFDDDLTDEEEIKIKGLFDEDEIANVEKQLIIPSSHFSEESNFDDWNFKNHRASELIRLLPPEIHYLILTFVDFKTLLTCQLISKQWYDFATRTEIWYPFYGHMVCTKSLTNIVCDQIRGESHSSGGLTVNDFTIYDKDGIALVPRQQHLSEEYLSWMLQEREAQDNESCEKTSFTEKSEADNTPSYRSLFLNKAVHKYKKKLRKKDLIEMYNTLNKFVQYLPMLKKICYLFFSIGILIFSLILPLLLENNGHLKEIEYLGKYYSTYVIICYGPVFFSHACCLAFCYYVYRTHVNLSYHDQNERLLIFSMTTVTSFLLDVTFETQLLCSIPLVFCIPIIMHIFDWGHTVSMIPVVITIMVQKFFYFIYEVQREKILKRKKWETLRSVNTALLFQVSLICFKLDKMLVLRYIFGDIVMHLTWTLAFTPAYLFGLIYCIQNFHQLQKSHWLAFKRDHKFITRQFIMFIGCLLLYETFWCMLGLKLDKPHKIDYSFFYIFLYWYAANIGVLMLKRDKIHSHLFLS